MFGVVVAGFDAPTIRADVREEFETPDPAWRLSDTDCARVTARRRVFGQAHRGEGSELLQLLCGQGSNAYLSYSIPRGRVIDELAAEMWIKSNRGGLQMLLRVVLPHARNPHDGKPLTRLIPGTVYSTPGAWQRLSVEAPATQLRKLLPSLRSQFGAEVTDREAYVDLVVLNAYGGPGLTNVFFDDLVVRRLVSVPAVAQGAADIRRTSHAETVSSNDRASQAGLRGDLMMVEGRPFFARMIDHRGESLGYLKSLGFNTVRLDVTATPAQLMEARRQQLWLVCPPPQLPDEGRMRNDYERVLAWSLGRGLGPREVLEIEQLAVRLRRADRVERRPLIAGVDGPTVRYGRVADIVLLERRPLGGSFPIRQYAPWLRQQQFRVRIGAPIWATVQTQHALALEQQVAALTSQNATESIPVDPRQLRLLAFASLSAGARGLHFTSRSRLDTNDSVTQLRAKTLELLNVELRLVEPWIAGGKWDELTTRESAVQFGMWQSERSRLLIGVRQADDQQHVLPATGKRVLYADVYGAPVTDQAFQVTSNGLKTLRQRRGSGSRIMLENAPLVSLVVLTENPLVVNHLSRYLIDNRKRQAQLEYEVAAEWLELMERVHQRLSSQSRARNEDEPLLTRARAEVIRSRRSLDTEDYQTARDMARAAGDNLARVRRANWRQAVASFASPVSSPLCVCFETLPMHWNLTHRLRTARWSANSLAGGDFESLEHMRNHGWSQRRHDQSGATVEVDLALEQPRQGRYALRIRTASRGDRIAEPGVPPVVIESAPVPVRPGALVRIQGWVLMPKRLSGCPDGLVIADSLAGRALAHRVHSADSWQPFTLYRAVPRNERQVSVRFAVHGFGEVLLDDVSISVLEPLAGAQP